MGFQRLPHHVINIASKTTLRSGAGLKQSTFQKPTTMASQTACISPLDRQEISQYQSDNFSTRLFFSTTTTTISDRKVGKKSEISTGQYKKFATHADVHNEAGYTLADERFNDSKPTIAYARSIPSDYSAMRHEQILQLAVEGDFGARQQALIRNIMGVDDIEYDEAEKILEQMWKFNRTSMKYHYAPYHAGFFTAITGGLISFPMIFSRDTVLNFNEKFVTTDVPVPEDLETYLEVSMWSWNWMEPICGQVSFVLLVLQFARSQMLNLGLRPFGDKMKQVRSNSLVKKYPQYNELFVRWFSEVDTMYGSSPMQSS